MSQQTHPNMTEAELTKEMQSVQGELQKLLFQVRANQLKDVRAIRRKRKELARIKTALARQ